MRGTCSVCGFWWFVFAFLDSSGGSPCFGVVAPPASVESSIDTFTGNWQGSYNDLFVESLVVRVWRSKTFGANEIIGEIDLPLVDIADSKMERRLEVLQLNERSQPSKGPLMLLVDGLSHTPTRLRGMALSQFDLFPFILIRRRDPVHNLAQDGATGVGCRCHGSYVSERSHNLAPVSHTMGRTRLQRQGLQLRSQLPQLGCQQVAFRRVPRLRILVLLHSGTQR